jgi:hypothetical protein
VGAFYSSVMVLDSDPERIAAVCSRPAYMVSDERVTVVFAAADDEGGGDISEGSLSAAVNAVTLSVLVHDSDLLALMIHRGGEMLLQGCVPDPAEYFGMDDDEPLQELTGSAIVSLLGRGDARAVDSALSDEDASAEDRHEAVLSALGLPIWSVGFGYRYLDAGPDTFAGPALQRLD